MPGSNTSTCDEQCTVKYEVEVNETSLTDVDNMLAENSDAVEGQCPSDVTERTPTTNKTNKAVDAATTTSEGNKDDRSYVIRSANGMEWVVNDVASEHNTVVRARSDWTVEDDRSPRPRKKSKKNQNESHARISKEKKQKSIRDIATATDLKTIVPPAFDHSAVVPKAHVTQANSPANVPPASDHSAVVSAVHDTQANPPATDSVPLTVDKSTIFTTATNESDDVSYIEPEPGCSWPKPLSYDLEGLVKREDDHFSGDLSFAQKVNMDVPLPPPPLYTFISYFNSYFLHIPGLIPKVFDRI